MWRNEHTALAIGLVCAAIAALLPMAVVPYFAETFTRFGADLPALTGFFVHHPGWCWLLPALVLMAARLPSSPRHRLDAPVLIGVGALVLMVPLLVVALYLPIFNLASGM